MSSAFGSNEDFPSLESVTAQFETQLQTAVERLNTLMSTAGVYGPANAQQIKSLTEAILAEINADHITLDRVEDINETLAAFASQPLEDARHGSHHLSSPITDCQDADWNAKFEELNNRLDLTGALMIGSRMVEVLIALGGGLGGFAQASAAVGDGGLTIPPIDGEPGICGTDLPDGHRVTLTPKPLETDIINPVNDGEISSL
jgi:hypothetical protein